MKILKTRDYAHMSRQAANIISAQVILKPDSILGLATGSSPVGTYERLVERYNKGDLDFSKISTFNLDEYVGLNAENPQSFHFFMHDNFFDHVNISHENIYIFDGTDTDENNQCNQFDALLERKSGIDLQLLGIGNNGHIGFNEPAMSFSKSSHRVALTEETIHANMKFFKEEKDVPKFAYTMGIKQIMQAKMIVMVVSGEDKAEAVKKAFFGDITPFVPASILQLHNNFILVADEAALSKV